MISLKKLIQLIIGIELKTFGKKKKNIQTEELKSNRIVQFFFY